MSDSDTKTIVWKVRDWDNLYENHKSRTYDECSFVCVPNKQHGTGFTRVLASSDGLANYGVFCLILGALSRQPRTRDGWMTDNGQSDGYAWTPSDMALRWRTDTSRILAAMAVLTGPSVGWIDTYERDSGVVSPQYPSGILEQNRTEQKVLARRDGETPNLEQWLTKAQFIGYDPKEAETAWNGLEAVGWMKNGQPVTKWDRLIVVFRDRLAERKNMRRGDGQSRGKGRVNNI